MNLNGIYLRPLSPESPFSDPQKYTHTYPEEGSQAGGTALRRPKGGSDRHTPYPKPPSEKDSRARVRQSMNKQELVLLCKDHGIKPKDILGRKGNWSEIRMKDYRDKMLKLIKLHDEQAETNAEEADVPAVQAVAPAPAAVEPPPSQVATVEQIMNSRHGGLAQGPLPSLESLLA